MIESIKMMEEIKYRTLTDTLLDLRGKGFTANFQFKEDEMRCSVTGNAYTPDDMYIAEYHRFEGVSNPSDMSLLIAVDCYDGNKGTIISSYGTYADAELTDFIRQLEINNKGSLQEG